MAAHFGKFVAYYRVSTDKQGESGLGLEAQREAVATYLNGGPWQMVGRVHRGRERQAEPTAPSWKALAACRGTGPPWSSPSSTASPATSTSSLGLMESGVDFVACDIPHANKLTIHILAAVAEDEAQPISERTKAALAAAKARGKTLGGPRLAAARRASIEVRREFADAFAANVRPIIKEDPGERRHQSARHRTRTNGSRRQDRSRRRLDLSASE